MPFYSNIGIRTRTESIGKDFIIDIRSQTLKSSYAGINSGSGGNLIIENYYPTLYGYK